MCDCSMLWYKLSSPCVMQQPKVSPIVIIRSHVEFLLKSAAIFNKSVIMCDRKDLQLFVKGHEFMMMELICLPRTSRNARVVFASELRSWESGPPVVIQSLAATDNGLVYSYGLLCRFDIGKCYIHNHKFHNSHSMMSILYHIECTSIWQIKSRPKPRPSHECRTAELLPLLLVL